MVVKLDNETCRKIGGTPVNSKCKLAKIITKKIPNKTDSFFYPVSGGEIASFEGKKNYYSLISSGDIQIDIDEDSYRNHDVDDAISKYKLTDKKLKDLEQKGRLIWNMNNWFEVEFRPKNDGAWESMIGNVAYGYDEAIQLLEDTVVEKELE